MLEYASCIDTLQTVKYTTNIQQGDRNMTNDTDERAIRGLVEAFVQGWNAGDGHACAKPFAENADFTAVTGARIKGRDLIGRGHVEILSTIFRGTRNTAIVNDITFLRPDVAAADVTFRLDPMADKPWLPPYSSCGIVATKENGTWSIAVFRNLVPFGRPVAGPLDREVLDASRAAAGVQ
jgi:uncharacterized protein (TIGR02246 family)